MANFTCVFPQLKKVSFFLFWFCFYILILLNLGQLKLILIFNLQLKSKASFVVYYDTFCNFKASFNYT